jgi:hypothetical protein
MLLTQGEVLDGLYHRKQTTGQIGSNNSQHTLQYAVNNLVGLTE